MYASRSGAQSPTQFAEMVVFVALPISVANFAVAVTKEYWKMMQVKVAAEHVITIASMMKAKLDSQKTAFFHRCNLLAEHGDPDDIFKWLSPTVAVCLFTEPFAPGEKCLFNLFYIESNTSHFLLS
jgi:hypothetical protein